MSIPQRILSGVCEISTGAFTAERMPVAYTGEIGALNVQIRFTMEGQPYCPNADAEMYLYYEQRHKMTVPVALSVSGDTAIGNLRESDMKIGGCPLLVVQLKSIETGQLIVTCDTPLRIERVRSGVVIYTGEAIPGETVYVGRAPYINSENTHWMEWDNETAQYVDTGVSAYGGQILEEVKTDEEGRVKAEQDRVKSENARGAAEKQRVEAEQRRASAESTRTNAEQGRVESENARKTAEKQRVEAEEARVRAEQARVEAENARVAKTNTATKKADDAAEDAKKAAEYIKNATFGVEKIAPGGDPKVTVTDEEGRMHVVYGVVTGDKGDQGDPFLIKGKAFPTVEALREAVTDAKEGDMYNVGDGPPYNIYRRTDREAPDDWEDQGVMQGPPGEAGEQGPPGEPGEQGPRGEPGETGATPMISVTVDTGEPGSDAKVEQSGTAEKPELKFTIPRGVNGKDAEGGEFVRMMHFLIPQEAWKQDSDGEGSYTVRTKHDSFTGRTCIIQWDVSASTERNQVADIVPDFTAGTMQLSTSELPIGELDMTMVLAERAEDVIELEVSEDE